MFGALISGLIRGVSTGYTREVHPHVSKSLDDRNERNRLELEKQENAEAHTRAVEHSRKQKEIDRKRFGAATQNTNPKDKNY